MFCSSCGSQISNEAKFCAECGAVTNSNVILGGEYKNTNPVHLANEINESIIIKKHDSFLNSIKKCFKNYANFNGRAGRSELWWFVLFQFILFLFLSLIDESGVLSGIFFLATMLPAAAVQTRRLHDVGRSGWWCLVSLTVVGYFLLIFWLVKNGDDGTNKYGDPI